MSEEPQAVEQELGVLRDIELEATLRFGSRPMTLREVLAHDVGDVVELDRHDSQPVELLIGDRIVARGQVVVSNGNFALSVSEVAEPQMRLEGVACRF